MNKKSKKRVFLLAGIVALLLMIIGIVLLWLSSQPPEENPIISTPTPTPTRAVIEHKYYTNKEYSFSVNYPSDWQVKDIENATTQEVVGFRDKDQQIWLIIKVEKLGEKPITLESYVNENVKLFLQKATIEEQNTDKNLAGFSRAYRLVYTQKDETGNTLKILETGGLTGENEEGFRAYVILYKADQDKFSQFQPEAEMMINSFTLIK